VFWGEVGEEGVHVCTDDSPSSGSSYESIMTSNVFSKLNFLFALLHWDNCVPQLVFHVLLAVFSFLKQLLLNFESYFHKTCDLWQSQRGRS